MSDPPTPRRQPVTRSPILPQGLTQFLPPRPSYGFASLAYREPRRSLSSEPDPTTIGSISQHLSRQQRQAIMPPRPPSDILDNEPGDPASEPSDHGRGGPLGPPPPGGSPHESEHGEPAGPPGGDPGGDNGGGPGGPGGPPGGGGPGSGPPGGPPGGGPPGGGPAPPAANPANDLEQTFLTTLQGINTFLSRPPTTHSTKPRLKEPPTFSGTNPEKLRPWLIDIAMHLSDRPDDFPTDEKKVNFALSFLTGVAKDFFSPDIFMALQDPFARAPPWRNDFHEFIRVLSENFGPFDSVGTAENTLNNLVMDASKPIANYIAHFNAAATLVGWDDNSLRFQFWRGLPAWL